MPSGSPLPCGGRPGGRGGATGRLVEPDEGTEKDMIAYDAGSAGGVPTAEEAAVHEVPGR
ncbi:hypothetical protein Drose_18525 [Dactylosporangium roseum]|uniref:DUF5709 domain-containing protein n=1 Tax=Dactylosporangium roseum TaxID=47989 RepID=A0ABY5ZF91_9ACTN|nr:hypothetical protein Drose_18525 [Dactylosporangium roseum]